MNLLFLNTYPAWGGGETWMLDVAEGLRARGHRCLVAGRPGRAWFERCRELGWDPIELNIRGEFAPLVCAKLRRIYGRDAIDLVVCNFYKEVRLAGTARFGKRRPAIVNMKGLPLISDTFRHRFGYRHFIDHTVVCARFILEEYRRYPWADPAKISVIYNCYKPPAPTATVAAPAGFRDELGIPHDHLVVGAIARFDYRKGLHDLIAAAPRVLAAQPKTTFVLVGDGREKAALVEQAMKSGIADRVRFTGFRFDLDAIVPAFDVFVLPSHHEGFPYVTQIAMHHARPIVATRVGAVPEAIEDGVNGLLVAPSSPEGLEAAIASLLADPERRKRLGAEAQKTLQARFSYEGMIDRFEDLFVKVAGERGAKIAGARGATVARARDAKIARAKGESGPPLTR